MSEPTIEVREFTTHGDNWWWGIKVNGEATVHRFMTKKEAEQYADIVRKEYPSWRKTS